MTSEKDLAKRLASLQRNLTKLGWQTGSHATIAAEASALLTRLAALGEEMETTEEERAEFFEAAGSLGAGRDMSNAVKRDFDRLNLELAEANVTELHERIFRAETNRDDWRKRTEAAEARLATVEAALKASAEFLKTYHRSNASWFNDRPTWDFIHDVIEPALHPEGQKGTGNG